MKPKMIFLSVIGVLLLGVLAVSFSYALWFSENQQSGNNVVNSGCLSITYTEEDGSLINLTKSYPISDIDGMRSSPYAFSVKNTCNTNASYDVLVEVLNTTNISHSLIKTSLDSSSPALVNTFNVVDSVTANSTSYKYDTYTIAPNEVVEHNFRMWVDSSATTANASNKTINVKLSVIASSIVLPYEEDLLAGNDPVLDSKMLPVTIADDGTVTVADVSKEWYSYENKEWANAVIVDSSFSAYIGKVIPMESIAQMYVWIPRYSYDSSSIESAAHAIDVTFVDTTQSAHPAFCWGNSCQTERGNIENEELTGIWIGKFEQGEDNTIKPNQNSIHDMNVSTLYDNINNAMTTYSLDEATDVHMMKNIEWGVVAYLSQSKYGVCNSDGTCSTKIKNNNYYNNGTDTDVVTGCGGSDTAVANNVSGVAICPEANRWTTDNGKAASTTRNITGIYDMAGGRREYVMGTMVDISGNFYESNAGFTFQPEHKYYDAYSYSSSASSYVTGLVGDATIELNPSQLINDAWNSDFSYMIHKDFIWFNRGGTYSNHIHSGIWAFNNANNGGSYSQFTSRSSMIII